MVILKPGLRSAKGKRSGIASILRTQSVSQRFTATRMASRQEQSTKYKVQSTSFPALLRRWTKVSIGNESGSRRIILLRGAANPQIPSKIFGGLYHHVVLPASGGDRYLPLQVSTI